MLEDEVLIENTCHGVGSKNVGRNWSADVVLRTNPVVLLANVFPRLNVNVRPPSFVLETSGITSILNYRSVSPIMQTSRFNPS